MGNAAAVAVLLLCLVAREGVHGATALASGELTAITALYNALGGPSWTSNKLSGDPCATHWRYTQCVISGGANHIVYVQTRGVRGKLGLRH